MGSLNNGRPISQTSKVVRHTAESVVISDYVTDTKLAEKTNVGTTVNSIYPVWGMAFAASGTFTSGVPIAGQTAFTSVNRQLFTENSLASGYLTWQITRQIDGIHNSVSKIRTVSSLGGPQTLSERKIFYIDTDRTKSSGFADWTIFDANGNAVGPTLGTTDTDITPSGFGGV